MDYFDGLRMTLSQSMCHSITVFWLLALISYCYALNPNGKSNGITRILNTARTTVVTGITGTTGITTRTTSRSTTRLHALVPIKQITDNKKSSFEYEFTETYEAGLMLTGTEVKSCRKGMVQLSDSMAEIINGEAWLLNCHIGEFQETDTIRIEY